MNINHLETLIWSVRLGSFSAAALKLNTTQPAVSMRIRKLEKILGADLFDRSKRSNQLTPKGREFLEYAIKITALSQEAQARIGDQKAFSGRIRLGVTETIALTWLPELVAKLNEFYPAVVVELEVGLTRGVWKQLESGDLDLALLPAPAPGPGMTSDSLGEIEYTWMASPKLNISNHVQAPKDLEQWPIITLSRDSALHFMIEDWFRDGGAEPRRVDVCNSLGVVAGLTVSGLGVCLLPPHIYQPEIEAGKLRVINIKPRLEPIKFVSAYPKGRLNKFAAIIARLAKETSWFENKEKPHGNS